MFKIRFNEVNKFVKYERKRSRINAPFNNLYTIKNIYLQIIQA